MLRSAFTPHVVAVPVRELAGLHRAPEVGVDRYPVGRDVVAGVVVLRHAGAPAVIDVVGERGDHHAPGQGVERVRTNQPAGGVHEVGDDLVQHGLARVGVDVKDEDLAGVEASGPQVLAIVGEAGVMRFVAPAHRQGVDHLAVGVGPGIGVDGDELVLLVPHPFDAQRPDVDVVFLALDLGDVGRHAGLVRVSGQAEQHGHGHRQVLEQRGRFHRSLPLG